MIRTPNQRIHNQDEEDIEGEEGAIEYSNTPSALELCTGQRSTKDRVRINEGAPRAGVGK